VGERTWRQARLSLALAQARPTLTFMPGVHRRVATTVIATMLLTASCTTLTSPTATDAFHNTTTVGDTTGGSGSRVVAPIPVASFEAQHLEPGAEVPIDQGNLVGDWSAAPADSWIQVLASIPETSNTRWAPITVVDLERAAITLEVDRPGPNAGDQAVFDYLGELASGAGIVPSGPLSAFGRSAFPDQLRAELGFDHRNIDRVASAGIGALEIVVAVGDFEKVAISEAVTNDPYWSDVLTTETYGDTTIHSWGIDFDLDFDRFSPTRSVGHNRRLAVEGGRLGWARWTSGIEDVVDAMTGNTRSLADVGDLASLAAVADDAGLLTGVISPSVSAFVVNLSDQRRAENLLLRPDALLVGDGIDEHGRFTLIALRYNNTISAAEELPVFEARMMSVSGLVREGDALRVLGTRRTFEIQQAGPTLIAKIWLTNGTIDDPSEALLPTASDLIAFT